MKALAIYSIKGGVGKTATAVNLAYLAARQGLRTLLWDLDPQAAASWYVKSRPRVNAMAQHITSKRSELEKALQSTEYAGLDVIPADFSNRNLGLLIANSKKPHKVISRQLANLGDHYDVVFLDCAPSISAVSESMFVAVDAVLVPTIPTPLSGRTLQQLRGYLDHHCQQPPGLMAMMSMVDRRKRLHRELSAEAEGDPLFLRARIPYSTLVEQMGTRQAPLFEFSAKSAPAVAYEEAWREAAERLGLPTP